MSTTVALLEGFSREAVGKMLVCIVQGGRLTKRTQEEVMLSSVQEVVYVEGGVAALCRVECSECGGREVGERGKVAKCKVWLVGGVVLSFSARCQPLLQCTGLPNVQAAALHRAWILIHPFMVFSLANPICHPAYSEHLLHQAQRVRA